MGTLKDKIFSDQICNDRRQLDLDLAKAVPIICLPFVHCIIECCTAEQLDYGLPFVFDCFIGGPMSAPMFMFAMGIGMIYSKKNSSSYMIRRGIMIFIAGYILNLARYVVPSLTGYAISGDYGKYIEPITYKLFANDIMQLAGLALILLGLLVRMKVPRWGIMTISTVMSLAGWAFNDVDMGNKTLNILLGNLIGTSDSTDMLITDFPLLNWFIFPAAGYCFGHWMIRMKNKKLFYLTVSPPALIISIVYYVLAIRYSLGMFRDGGENTYYHIVFYEVVAIVINLFALMGIYYLISKILPTWLLRFFTDVSRKINAIYCIHWVYLVFATNVIIYLILGTQIIPLWQILVLSAGIFAATYLTAVIWDHIKQRRRIRSAKEQA